jgi:hypothetical protein
MHGRTDRDVAQRQGVAGLDRRIAARDHLVAGLQALRRDDVAALAVDVAQQRDVRGAVRIVFDALDAGRDAFLVALEVDDAVVLLVATTDVTGGDAAVVVAAAGLALLLDQRRVRRALVQVRRHHADHRAAAGRGGLEFINAMGGSSGLGVMTSIDWPSASVTYALRQSPRRPAERKDLDLPFTFTTFTASTLTSNKLLHRGLDVGLGGVFATSKTYWLETSCRRAVFSDTRGARSTLVDVGCSCQPLLDLLDRIGR